MGAGSLLFGLLAVSGTVVQGYPYASIAPFPSSTRRQSESSSIPSHTNPSGGSRPTGYHASGTGASSSTSLSPEQQAAAYASAIKQALAENPGPGTTLDAAQVKNKMEFASIAAQGSSLHAAGVASASAAATAAPNCNDGSWALSVQNYNKFDTDKNLKAWWFGGNDSDGITYKAKAGPQTFLTESLAATFEPTGSNFVCTLESQGCQPVAGCENYAVHLDGSKQSGIAQYWGQMGPSSHWGWFAIHSISNIASFLQNFNQGFTDAGVIAALTNIDMTKTFTQPTASLNILTRDLLLGFAMLATLVFSFVPVVGEVVLGAGAAIGSAAIGALGITAGATLSTSGAYLANTLVSKTSTLDIKAAEFGSYMSTVYQSTAAAIDDVVSKMMHGDSVGGGPTDTPTLFNVIEGGGWVTSNSITVPGVSIADLQNLLRNDLLQRGINHLWSKSKTWVTFVDLKDTDGSKCAADKNGWQASKTCRDGGVYYLYRFNEDSGSETGHLSYPWGADKMQGAPWNLNPAWVTHSSATAYRSQKNGAGGFAYDYSKAPTNIPDILSAIDKTHSLDSLNALEGVYNISVCDMGTHTDWNADFTPSGDMITQNQDYKDGNIPFIFPCCCGPGCSQTKDFIQSSNMDNFHTVFDACKQQLSQCSAWPAGVTQVDFGKAGVIKKQDQGYNNQCVSTLDLPWNNNFLSPGDRRRGVDS